LKEGGTIQNDLLPFDVQVVRYMVNSDRPQEARSGEKNPATAGDRLALVAAPRPEVSGADPEQTIDFPSAYVSFKAKWSGEVLGTYLVTMWWSDYLKLWGEDRPQQV